MLPYSLDVKFEPLRSVLDMNEVGQLNDAYRGGKKASTYTDNMGHEGIDNSKSDDQY